jgi:hypothetical protein
MAGLLVIRFWQGFFGSVSVNGADCSRICMLMIACSLALLLVVPLWATCTA